jgi:hypothetical protein
MSAGAAASAGCGGNPHGFSTVYQTAVDPDYDSAPAIFGIGGLGSNDVWVTAQFGFAFHDRGGNWTATPTGASGSLAAPTGVTSSNAFAFDEIYNDLYQWDGQRWFEEGGRDSARFAVWADSVGSVWSAGEGMQHWDGTFWSPVPSNDSGFFGSISGANGDPSTMLAASIDGGVVHYDGARWVDVPSPASGFYGVSVGSATDGWLVGAGGAVVHWDGTALALVDAGTTVDLSAVSATAPDNVWVGGDRGTLLRWDGAAWTALELPGSGDINCVWSPGRGEVWIGDTTGRVTRYVE